MKKVPPEVKPPPAAKRISLDIPCVAWDRQRRTCIVVADSHDHVKFIPLSYDQGLLVESLPAKEFGLLYEPQADYPAERAATLYVGYSHTIGASEEALEFLGRIVKLSPKDIEMASKKPAAKAAAKNAAKNAAPAKKTAVKKGPVAPKKEAGERKPSAASLFKELIMAGGKTDDQIFAAVQKKFVLADDKRSYVGWYRKDLEKKGMNPPAAK